MKHTFFALKSKSLAFAFVAVTSVFAVQPALGQTCSVDCLRVYSIVLADLGNRISGTVKLTDETGAGAGARSAVVHVLWSRPDGSTLDQYDVIGTRLRAEFSLYTNTAPGTYTLTVMGATKPGYTFDPENSALLSKTITIASQDSDQDGVSDQADNCLLTSNPDQTDADGDGFGNLCDADFNNDCMVNFTDLSIFGAAFLTNDDTTDLNGDGVVNFLDMETLQSFFLTTPGPSDVATLCN